MADFEWTFPYPSQRMPVLAKNLVATSQPLAAQAGLEMIRRGGNAIDAAVATAIALTVTEPTSNGIGSDAFALVWAGGGLHGLNGSGRAPRALSPDRFNGESRMPFRGWGPITVPGCVSAWVALHERFGALPFEALFEPAIHHAEIGYLVAPQTAYYWDRGLSAYRDVPEWRRTFAPNGRAPGAGELVKLPDHAQTLRAIAESKGEAFYRGALAQKIIAASDADDGVMTLEDLASHQADWVRPISIDYRGYRLHEIPPNGQGLAALLMLGIVRHFDLASLDPDGADALHLQIEAMKLAFADGHRYIADPKWMDVDVADLLDEAYLESRAQLIDPKRAQDFEHGEPKPGGTVLLAAADAEGNMVTFIQSNYTGFGSGVVIPGTGIAMQNRGACFTLEDGHPNQVGGGKRPYHTIIPAFVTRSAQAGAQRSEAPGFAAPEVPVMAFGVMGGFMQPQGHAQVMIRLADYRQNPQAALDAPRWSVETGREVSIEPGFAPAVYEELRARGHEVSIARACTVAHGGAQAILTLEGGYFGASDLRRDGQAVGF